MKMNSSKCSYYTQYTLLFHILIQCKGQGVLYKEVSHSTSLFSRNVASAADTISPLKEDHFYANAVFV
jgi:hypothetical protein